ncbi:MAG TPA: MarR family transcriptional regulator [Acidimicrobiales bacterium]|nr:MarR family transcriptional regulator [Acidimicrobiales bacterium]
MSSVPSISPATAATAATTTAITGPAGDSPATGTYGRVAAWLSKRVEVALARMDLTLPQYRVLGILAEGSAAASGLADRLAVRPPSITAVIDGLVARGLVERKQEDSDRRKIALRLTAEGVRTVAEADRSVDEYLASIAGCLPGRDQATALRSLELWGRALTTFHQARRQLQ